MKRSRMLLGALLIGTASFAVICSCPPVHEALWFADGGGIGAKVLVDGKLLGVLESSGDRSYALRAPYYLAPCYSEGDTVVAVGEDRVGMFLNMPDGEHPVTVVTKGGDSVSVTAYLWDSPGFFLWVECGILYYPSREGQKTAQFQRRGGPAGSSLGLARMPGRDRARGTRRRATPTTSTGGSIGSSDRTGSRSRWTTSRRAGGWSG